MKSSSVNRLQKGARFNLEASDLEQPIVSQETCRIHAMLCFRGSVDVAEPIAIRLEFQREVSWLSAFLDSEEYLTDCPLNCFKKKKVDGKPVKAHRRRYFCVDCPEEGVLCLPRVMDQHLKHKVLKVQKVSDGGGPVIKVRDIDPLLNISCVNRLTNTSDESTYVKLRSFRQVVWEGSPHQILCYECMRLANNKDYQKYKFCSIQCAYPSHKVISSPQLTGYRCMNSNPVATDNIQTRQLSKSLSCRRTSIKYDQETPRCIIPVTEVPTSPCSSGSTASSTTGWRSRLSRIFSVSKKQIPHMKNLSPTNQEERSSWEKFDLSPLNEKELAHSGLRPGQTLLGERHHTNDNNDNMRTSKKMSSYGTNVKDSLKEDNRVSSSIDSNPCTEKKLPTAIKSSTRTSSNDQNVRPARICWKPQETSDDETVEEGLKDRWGSVRGRILNSDNLPYIRFKLENRIRCRPHTQEDQISHTIVEPYTINGLADDNSECEHSEMPHVKSVLYLKPSQDHETQTHEGESENNVSNMSRRSKTEQPGFQGNYLTKRNELFELREQWGGESTFDSEELCNYTQVKSVQ